MVVTTDKFRKQYFGVIFSSDKEWFYWREVENLNKFKYIFHKIQIYLAI